LMKSHIHCRRIFPYLAVVGSVLMFMMVLTGAQPLPEPAIPEISCLEAEACFRHAVFLVDSNPENLELPLRRFAAVQEKFPETVWSKRAGFRIGLLLADRDPARALSLLEKASQDFPLLRDYLSLRQALLLSVLERNIEAADLLESVLDSDPSPVFLSDILHQAGYARYRAQQCRLALPLLQQAHARDSDHPQASRGLYAIAECADRLGLSEKSQSALQEIWWRYPDSPESRLLRDAQTGDPVHGLSSVISPDHYYQRAISFMKLAQFEGAIADLQVFLKSEPRKARYEQGQFKLAMANVRLKRYPIAEQVFQGLAKTSSTWQGRATVWLARVYLRQGKGLALLDLRNALPSGLSLSDRSQIFWMCGIWFEDQGEFESSAAAYEQAALAGGSTKTRAEALWRLGWLQYQQGKYEKARTAFLHMREDQVGSGRRSRQAQYWLAKTLRQLNETEQARILFQQLAQDSPLTYYGQLALQNLSDSQVSTMVEEFYLGVEKNGPTTQASYLDNIHFQKSQQFRLLGLMEMASLELMQAVEGFRNDRESLSELAIHLMKTEAYDAGLQIARRYFGEEIEQGRIAKTSLLWHVAYPRGYLPHIRAVASSRVDPYLVAGIIREESLFDPRALSRVGAMGLMQLMPKTAHRLAHQLGMPELPREDLFLSEINIRLGVRYVSELLEQYGGNLAYTIAAYNAGPQAVSRWTQKFGHREQDEFVELISYKETRGYVKRVLTSYRAYRLLVPTTCGRSSLDMSC